MTRNGSSVRTEERFDQGGGESNLKFLETKGFKLVEGTTLARTVYSRRFPDGRRDEGLLVAALLDSSKP